MLGLNERLTAFMKKETLQLIRDPSSFLIAVLLPLLMIFLFGYGVSLDADHIKIGVVLENKSEAGLSLYRAFESTHYFSPIEKDARKTIEDQIMRAQLRGMVVIPQDFSRNLDNHVASAIQVISDGSEPNTAVFVENYAQGVLSNWWENWERERGTTILPSLINPEVRVWFNPELISRYVLLPGSIAVIMSLIGILLTALVVAREWERGTMEVILTTPIRLHELILGKLLPYFFLGLGSMSLCMMASVWLFDVPFLGSFWILIFATSLFLIVGLSQGLLISILAKNQFVAGQAAINAAFLPAYMLSGFLYEIHSMPMPIQWLTFLVPARYFVTIIQTLFLAGDIWPLLLPNLGALALMGLLFGSLVTIKMRKEMP